MAVPPLLSTASAFHSTLSGSSGTSTMRARYRHAWEASCAVAQQAAPSECAGTHSIQSYAASRSRCHAYPSTLQTHRKDDRVTCRRPHNSPPRVPLAWRGAPPPPTHALLRSAGTRPALPQRWRAQRQARKQSPGASARHSRAAVHAAHYIGPPRLPPTALPASAALQRQSLCSSSKVTARKRAGARRGPCPH